MQHINICRESSICMGVQLARGARKAVAPSHAISPSFQALPAGTWVSQGVPRVPLYDGAVGRTTINSGRRGRSNRRFPIPTFQRFIIRFRVSTTDMIHGRKGIFTLEVVPYLSTRQLTFWTWHRPQLEVARPWCSSFLLQLVPSFAIPPSPEGGAMSYATKQVQEL